MVLAWPRKTSPVEPSSEIQSPSFSTSVLPLDVHGHLACLCSLTVNRAGAGHAGRSHAASDHGRVAGHAAARSQNALRDFHAVNVVRLRFRRGPGSRGRLSALVTASSAVNTTVPTAAPGDAGSPVAIFCSVFLRCGIEHRMQQLIELLRIDAQHRFAAS